MQKLKARRVRMAWSMKIRFQSIIYKEKINLKRKLIHKNNLNRNRQKKRLTPKKIKK